jgi:hypothetical protein
MAVLRFLANMFLLVAIVAFAADVTPALNGAGPFKVTALANHWHQLAPTTLARARDVILQSQAPFLWSYAIGPLTALPSFVVFGLLSALTGYFGRHRHKVEIFVN